MRKFIGCIAGLLLVAACSSVAPIPIKDGDVCYRCRQLITDPNIAGELLGQRGIATTFGSAGCLSQYLAEHSNDTSTAFVADNISGRLTPVANLLFVPTVNRSNGERIYKAFLKKEVAEQVAKESNATTMTWQQVLEKAKSGQGN